MQVHCGSIYGDQPTPVPPTLAQVQRRMDGQAWPVVARLFPERLEIDENRSFWVARRRATGHVRRSKGRIDADLAIIGGGFTGISTAYHFSRRFPNSVSCSWKPTLGNGASGRNGGMMLNWVNGIDHSDPELTARIYQLTSAGMAGILALIERHVCPWTIVATAR